VTQSVVPAGYPTNGFYCPLHTYQTPKFLPSGAAKFENPVIDEHVRRRTSFVAPEASVATDMLRAVGVAKDGVGTGARIAAWISERRSLDADGATAYCQRMVELGMLVAVSAGPGAPEPAKGVFTADKAAFYRIVPTAGGGGGGSGGGAGAAAGAGRS